MASGVDPNVILLRLEDAVSSLRTSLMIVGVIAVAALGIASYALIRESSGSDSGAVSEERVSQLEDRIDRLSRQVQDVRAASPNGSGGDAALADRVDALERTVKTLADRPTPDATQAVEELSSRIDALSGDVEELKQAQPTTP